MAPDEGAPYLKPNPCQRENSNKGVVIVSPARLEPTNGYNVMVLSIKSKVTEQKPCSTLCMQPAIMKVGR